MAIADRIVVMNAGRIEDAGPPARVYRSPATLFAADFMGEMNHFPARAGPGCVETPFGTLPLDPPAARDLVVCLRPEAVRSDANGTPLGAATVREAAFFGTHGRVHLSPDAAPEALLIAHVAPDAMPTPGDRIELSADLQAMHVFAKEGTA